MELTPETVEHQFSRLSQTGVFCDFVPVEEDAVTCLNLTDMEVAVLGRFHPFGPTRRLFLDGVEAVDIAAK